MTWYEPWTWDDTPVNSDQWTVTITVDPSTGNSVQKVHVDSASPGAAEEAAGEFVYLDCGMWAGAPADGAEAYQRNFGVVCGNHVFLCSFVTGGGNWGENTVVAWDGGPSADQFPEVAPAFAVLSALGGSDSRVTLIKVVTYNGLSRRKTDPEFVYVFIPDMHIPMLTAFPAVEAGTSFSGTCYQEDGPADGRYEYFEENPDKDRVDGAPIDDKDRLPVDPVDGTASDGGGVKVLGYGAEQWFDRYLAADISKKEAAEDMIEFIRRLESCGDERVKLVQVGDMIDLWIGFDAFFEPTPANAPDIILTQAKPASFFSPHPKISGADFVNNWIGRATSQPPATGGHAESIRLMSSFKYQRTFIYGNHDCYFKKVSPSSIGPRQESLLEDGLYAEHGHQGDSFNRDGAGLFWGAIPAGQTVTNQVFKRPPLRYGYPMVPGVDIRGQALIWAATQWYTKRFVIYVQGHTHTAGLGLVKVEIAEKPAVNVDRYTPRYPFEPKY